MFALLITQQSIIPNASQRSRIGQSYAGARFGTDWSPSLVQIPAAGRSVQVRIAVVVTARDSDSGCVVTCVGRGIFGRIAAVVKDPEAAAPRSGCADGGVAQI
jgi:hypothetical protein